jgi:hypothetical protein
MHTFSNKSTIKKEKMQSIAHNYFNLVFNLK